MKEQKTQISKIVIEVAGHKIDLTIEQAHELQNILNETFPDKKPNVTVIERDHWYPRPYYVGHSTTNPTWKHWDVTCGLGAQSGGINDGMMRLCATTNDTRRNQS